MKNIKNLKIRIAALALAATCSLAALPSVAYAAELDEEEILYEETADNYTQEDIPPVEVEEGTTYEEVHPEETETQAPAESQEPTETQLPAYTGDPNQFIDATNWSQEIDPDPTAGQYIPDYVQTEWERKHPTTPTDDTPTDDTPTDDTPTNDTPTNDTPTDDTPTDDTPTDDTPTDDTPTDDTPSIPKTADGYARFALAGGVGTGALFAIKRILETIRGSVAFAKETDATNSLEGATRIVSSKKKSKFKSKSKKLR